MNKITKPILVSALSALAFGTVGVAGTFALFTDDSKTTISAQAGIVDVGLTPSGLTTYSAEANAQGDRIDERGAKYISKLTEVEGTFTNGGTASLNEGVLSMDRLTPGDRVTFQAGLVNNSNVAIKYRLVYKFTGTSGVLAQGLVTKTNISGSQQTYEGLKEFVAPWTFLEAGATIGGDAITFDIELPINRGNEYQNKDASFSFYVEAVQGNAYVEDDPKTLLFGELTPTQEAEQEVVDPAQPTILQTTSELATTTVKTTIPGGTSYQTDPQQAAEPIATDDTVKLVVSDLIVAEDTATKKGTVDLDISLLVNGVEVTQFSEFVNVEVNVGKNLDITSVTHNGNAVTGYTYTASEGILRFTTKNFSPFSVEYTLMPNTSYGFFDSYVQDGHWVHEIKTKAHFKNIDTHLKEAYPGADYTTDPTVNDSTAYYVILNDIDFEGRIWSNTEIDSLSTFSGHLVSGIPGENVVLSNAEAPVRSNVIRSDWYSAGGLFNLALDASFEGITLEDFSIDASNGKGCGLFLAGNNADLGTAHTLSFVDCVIDDSCVMNVSANSGGFVGSTRGISEVSFDGCVNNANIVASSTNIGGFVGTGTTMSSNVTNSISFDDCVNNGFVMGSDFVGGFTGNTGNGGRYLSGSGNASNGNVYVIGNGTYYGFFFPGNSWYKLDEDHTFSGSIGENARIKAGDTTNGFEKGKLGENYVISANNVALDGTTYLEHIDSWSLVTLEASFDANDKLAFANTVDCDDIVINIRSHGLRISKTEWWLAYSESGLPVIDPQTQEQDLTNEMGGSLQSETRPYIASLHFDSVAAVDVTKVTQCGYFIPENANAPHASYNAGFETFLISDNTLLANPDYSDGYHVKNGIGYIVAANDMEDSDQYLAICDWRNDVTYEIIAYKDGAIVGRGEVSYGRGEGDSTYLTAINFGD